MSLMMQADPPEPAGTACNVRHAHLCPPCIAEGDGGVAEPGRVAGEQAEPALVRKTCKCK